MRRGLRGGGLGTPHPQGRVLMAAAARTKAERLRELAVRKQTLERERQAAQARLTNVETLIEDLNSQIAVVEGLP